ncbi:MAG: transposase [Acidobacteria bacterium]|nr:transposase [Acidobacteriota bacterium]
MLAVLNVPTGHRKRLRTTNHVERVNQELKRPGHTVRIWPNPASRDRLLWRAVHGAARAVARYRLVETGGRMTSASQGPAPVELRPPSRAPCDDHYGPSIWRDS